MSSFKFFVFLFLIPIIFSSLCININFYPVSVNKDNSFEIGPKKESCYKYTLPSTKKKIILVFPKTISRTSEVLLYKSKSDIQMISGEYRKYLDRFLINENAFKEIDLSNYQSEIFFIIRDGKYNQDYKNYFILYDTEIPITLNEGKPLTIKYFLKNNEYKFDFQSKKNLIFVYSTKVKNKKYISITYDNQAIFQKGIDQSDHLFYLKNENSTISKRLYVTVEDIEEGNEDQEFSVVVYEKNITQFFEVKRETPYTTNYLSLNKAEENQIFFFYYKLETSINKINTINIKLNPLAYTSDYIRIQSGSYHSMKDIPDNEKDIYFRFNGNKFPIRYDNISKEYIKIYYQDSDTSFTYRYIYFKVEISKTENYFSPQDFVITIGQGVEEKYFKTISYYKAQVISVALKPNIPYYLKINIDANEKYLLTSPLPESTTYTKGDLIYTDENNIIKINENIFTDPDEIIVLSGISELTLSIINNKSSLSVEYYYLEKFVDKEVTIIENYRNYEPIELVFDKEECEADKKKYILGIYNKKIYGEYNKTYTKYWTSNNGGRFNVYYRNGISVEQNSIFPIKDKYLQKKEYTIILRYYLDFFTFRCKKPGTISLRSPYKIFNETTHIIGQNSIMKISLSNKLEILQLSAPLKDPTYFLFVGIFSKFGKSIKISPDCPQLFRERTIYGDQPLLLMIDLHKFQQDQLALKLLAEESTQIEVVEVMRYNFTEYTVLSNYKQRKITDNNLVRFLKPNTKQITFKLNGLKDTEIVFGYVKLFTDNVNYLPMAFQFKEDNFLRRKLASKIESVTIKNPFLNNYEVNNKKYLAFVCSIPDYKYHSYEAQVILDDEEKKAKKDNNLAVKISLSIVGVLILIVIVVIVIYYLVKKKKDKKTEDLDEYIKQEDSKNNNDNIESINDEENNIDTQIENNNVTKNSNYNSISSDNNKNKYIKKFDDEDDDDRRLYKSFSED